MSLLPRSHALSAAALGPPDLPEAFAFLDADPVVNVYLMALLLRDALGAPRDRYWAVRHEGDMVGMLYLGGHSGAVLPVGENPEAMRMLGSVAARSLQGLPRRLQLIGARVSIAPFLETFRATGLAPRLDRDQIFMVLDREGLASFERLAALGPARASDFALLFESGALLRSEELDEDPRRIDPAGYRRRVEEECRDGHTYVWKDADGLCFRATVSAQTGDAAQVSGVYTPPARRNRGHASRALSELCGRLLEQSRSVCLFVNDFNAPALAVYRRIGFRDRLAWRSLFYDRGA